MSTTTARSRYGVTAMALCTLIVLLTPSGASAAPPSNDNFADRRQISSIPYSDQKNTSDATLEDEEPVPSCIYNPGRTIWYEYTPTTSGVLQADNLQSNFLYVAIAVWEGQSLDTLRELVCSDRSGGWGAVAYLPVTAGSTYFFQVAGFNEEGGSLNFHLDVSRVGSISGTVSSEADGPQRACVYLYSAGSTEPGSYMETTGSGIYTFGDIGDGAYKLRFADCFQRRDHEEEWFSDKHSWEEADEVLVVDRAGVTGVDAELDEITTAHLSVLTYGDGSGMITSQPAGIQCGSDCEETYPLDTTVILTVEPNADSDFLFWSGCDYSSGNQPDCRVNLGGAREVTAIFAASDGSPDTIIAAGPRYATRSRTAEFEFESTSPESTFECSLDGQDMVSCSSPATYNDLSEDMHFFRVRAVDAEGRSDATPPTWNWQVDLTPPETNLFTTPPKLTNSRKAYFEFASSEWWEEGFLFDCSLDGEPFNVCNYYAEYTLLDPGTHLFRVRARDPSGNVDDTPEEWTWTIDTAHPETSFISGPSGITGVRQATFEFTSSKTDSRFACSLDGAEPEDCESPMTTPELADGAHTLAVRATDPLGNMDPTPALRSWSVDTQPPEVAILRPTSGVYVNNQAITGTGPIVVVGMVSVEVRATDVGSGIADFRFEVNGLPVDPSLVSAEGDVFRFAFRPTTPNTYNIRGRATDGSGLSASVSLQVNGVPGPEGA